jgi:hypothetical protein
MAQPRCAVLVLAAVVVLAACSSDGGSSAGDTTAPGGTEPGASQPGGSEATGGTTAGSSATETGATDSLPVATTNIVGLVVGGSGGGVGEDQTDSLSEVVREEDGSCRGWDGPGGGWTAGVKDGAEVRLFDAEEGGKVLATGTLSAGKATDVDPPQEQWQCVFDLAISAVRVAPRYWAEVDSLPRVEARPDADGTLVIPVSTRAKADLVSACTDPVLPQTVGDWRSVGQYWSQGIPSICSAGLRISRLDRVCRPSNIASDRVVAVVDAGDGTVFEDATGLKVDPASLEAGTIVIAQISTAYPCR